MILSFCLAVTAATQYHGQVTFNGQPVPGATVTATRGDKKSVAITDEMGVYSFDDLDDGTWKFQVEMRGFATQTQDITIGANAPPVTWELKMLPLAEITKGLAPPIAENAPTTTPPPTTNENTPASSLPPVPSPSGAPRQNQRPAANGNNTNNNTSQTPPTPPSEANSDELQQRAATGLIVNGSVNNGAASAYAQMNSFGNNRRGPASIYNGGLGLTFDTSAWDAASFSQTGLTVPKPSYNDATFFGAIGGPLGIPHHLISNSQFFVAYQHAESDISQTLTGRVPTQLERSGNLSQTLTSSGTPVQVYMPGTNTLFPNSIVPVSPQAQALLSEYPLPNVSTTGAYNYEAPVLSASQTDSVQSRASKNEGRNQFFGTLAYQHQAGQSTSLFGFQDSSKTSGLDTAINWARFFRPGGITFFTTNFKYEFSRLSSDATPYFANRTNVSGNAGITGNDQTALNWGPPNFNFSSGVAGLFEPQYARNVNQTQAFSYSSLWYRGKHSLEFGSDVRRLQFNVISQQDARGALAFTGAATQDISGGVPVAGTGSDLADFLLGIPDTASIAYGNADKYLRGWGYDAFVDDDWRAKAGFTLHAGLRWEFAQPLTELDNRLVNLDFAPDFTAAAPVLASDPIGAITGQRYSNSLLRPDYRGVEPRTGIAWRPKANSPLVIRAGYGVYDITSVYQVIAMQMAQQPPLSKTFSLQNSAATPLTLASAFNTLPVSVPNTFSVDPNFRIGYAQVWDASVQQDLPGSLVMTASYLGTKGTRLMQEYLPNTYPVGAENPCPACPLGFAYLGSNANSTREAGQVQLRRRLRDGLTATLQYAYAKAIDDADAFSASGLATASTPTANVLPGTGGSSTNNSGGNGSGAASGGPGSGGGASASGPTIAQNWRNLNAERGLSSFDQRNLLTFTMQYTTGEGIRGGALLSGWRGTLLREWTVTTQLTVGSGFPLTPVYETNVAGTGVVGTIRPDYTGAPIRENSDGRYLNAAAYTAPAPGQWGDAGRNSIIGPDQFTLNVSVSRVFRIGSRLNAQWETSATNVLNTVTFPSWNTVVTSPLFGLPNPANAMRKLQTTLRVRF